MKWASDRQSCRAGSLSLQRPPAREMIENGETVSAIAKEMKTSRQTIQTIMRVRDQG